MSAQIRLGRWSALSAVALLVAACSGTAATSPPASQSAAATSPPASESMGASSSASASAPSSADAQAAIDAVCQKGVQEGAVTMWANVDQDVFAQETAPFVQKYPQIKVTESAASPVDFVPRIVTSATAGKAPEADGVLGAAPSLDPLVQRGLIDTTYDWVALGQPQDEILNGMLRHYRLIVGLGYGTQTVQKSDLPDTWDQLIDPKWDGQVIVDPRGYTFRDLALAWGEPKTLDYVQKLKSTDHPIAISGFTDGAVAIGSGQAKITTSMRDAETAEQQSKGNPIDIKYLDYVPVYDSYLGVVKGSAHPNAAACLIAWMNGEEGLQLQKQIEFKGNETQPSAVPSTSHLIFIDTPEKADLDNKVASDVAKIWANK